MRPLPVLCASVWLLVACTAPGRPAPPPEFAGGDVERGRSLIESFGCGSCHTIPGVRGADATVGPPLNDFGERAFIAGQLANTPQNLVRWVMDPQTVEPGTAMPDLGVNAEQARHIAAYLEALQ